VPRLRERRNERFADSFARWALRTRRTTSPYGIPRCATPSGSAPRQRARASDRRLILRTVPLRALVIACRLSAALPASAHGGHAITKSRRHDEQRAATFAFTSTATGPPSASRARSTRTSSCASPVDYAGLATARTRSRSIPSACSTMSRGAVCLVVDATPPSTFFTGVPPAQTRSQTAIFTFGASEPADVRVHARRPQHRRVQLAAHDQRAHGRHELGIAATDRAGNTDTHGATHAWRW